MLVIDESHKIKTPASKRTKRTITIAQYSPYRRILTGTPITQGLQDLYSQMKFLNWRIVDCKTYAEFKSIYCIMGGFEMRQITGYRNVEMLQRRIAPHVYEVNKRDCLDLPPETFVIREVPLSPEQRKLYKTMKEEFLVELDSGMVVEAPLALTRVTRLLQIVSGFIGDQPLPCPRIEACIDIVQESTRGKIIIWTHYQNDVRRIAHALSQEGIGYILYYGGVSPNERALALARWREDPKLHVMIGTPQCGGVGLNLTEADTEIFYSHDWNLEHRIQALARIMRPGQKRPCTYYDLIAPGTLETKLMKVLSTKDATAALFRNLNAIRELIASEE
jgi:SNF2 family DNA or RNA helicase